MAACLGIVDPAAGKRFIIDCTPDFREQLRLLDEKHPVDGTPGLDGILLTHAHTGHYAGLIHLGREMIGAGGVPVYCAPGMFGFLLNNQPWRSLVDYGNINLVRLEPGRSVTLTPNIAVTPFTVPHRDELSETVGYIVAGPSRRIVHLPDIDAWDGLTQSIEELVAAHDLLYLDGTFFTKDELPNRDPAEVPHPSIMESMERFAALPDGLRERVRFTHFNHTNPVVRGDSGTLTAIRSAGMEVAVEGGIEWL